MTDPTKRAIAPWEDSSAQSWMNNLESWRQMRRLILGTLKLDAATNSHEIRAAASLVIMLCRDGLWQTDDATTLDEIVELAAKQLATIKHLYESKARIDPNLRGNPKYRTLLTTLDQEVRILEARCSDPKPVLPNSPPITWGKFWFDDETS